MSSINQTLKSSKDWIVINLVLDDDLLISLIDQLNHHLHKLQLNWKLNVMVLELSSIPKEKIERSFQGLFQKVLTSLTLHKKEF